MLIYFFCVCMHLVNFTVFLKRDICLGFMIIGSTETWLSFPLLFTSPLLNTRSTGTLGALFLSICQNFIGSRHGCDANIIEVYTYLIVMIISNSVKNTPWVYKSMGNYAILPNVSKYTFSFQTKL